MKSILIAVGSLLILVSPALRAQFTYSIQDLGSLGGSTSTGNSLNASGQVAGASYPEGDQVQNAFISGPDGALPLRNLMTLGGSESFGQAINASGRVAGTSKIEGDTSFQAFLSAANGGALKGLGTLGGTNSYGNGVNGSGQVAGYSNLSGNNHAFLSAPDGGALADLGTLHPGTSSFAFAVNASGQVSGYSGTASGFNHAFISEPNGGALRDLGTLGGRFSLGLAINDAGQVVGRSEVGMGVIGQHAFRSGPNGGPLLDLGTLGGFSSFGLGINGAGTVVGYSYLGDNSTQRAFIYATAYGMVDLSALLVAANGWTLQEARAINDKGQITGHGRIGPETHGFLLTPVLPAIQISSITKLENGFMRVKGLGAPSKMHAVQVTAELSDEFMTLTTIVAGSDGVLQFDDANAPNVGRRFYRFRFP